MVTQRFQDLYMWNLKIKDLERACRFHMNPNLIFTFNIARSRLYLQYHTMVVILLTWNMGNNLINPYPLWLSGAEGKKIMKDLSLSVLSRGCGRFISSHRTAGHHDERLDVCFTPQVHIHLQTHSNL